MTYATHNKIVLITRYFKLLKTRTRQSWWQQSNPLPSHISRTKNQFSAVPRKECCICWSSIIFNDRTYLFEDATNSSSSTPRFFLRMAEVTTSCSILFFGGIRPVTNARAQKVLLRLPRKFQLLLNLWSKGESTTTSHHTFYFYLRL